MAKLGQDRHDRGARVIASAFLDFGYAVETALFQTPEECGAGDRGWRPVVGVSSLAAGHKTLPALIEALRAAGREDIIVICGGVIPSRTTGAGSGGVAAIFGPGTNVLDAGARARSGHGQAAQRLRPVDCRLWPRAAAAAGDNVAWRFAAKLPASTTSKPARVIMASSPSVEKKRTTGGAFRSIASAGSSRASPRSAAPCLWRPDRGSC